ncbi:hypothetical protein Nepgr_021757 [Nepenthes gracilis]|uniref:Uncharacterized protein n=1 Tax=Nepenthes gracilis TaxID=150966 RepID=A0AAD3SZK0_NEPGR|nr:hypothetical protein Nepgr_021757 [Nepenthes gracilis]
MMLVDFRLIFSLQWQMKMDLMMEQLRPLLAEPYDSISYAFVTYRSCAIDLVEGESPPSSAILLVLVPSHFPTFVVRQLFHDFSTYHAGYATLVGAIDFTAYEIEYYGKWQSFFVCNINMLSVTIRPGLKLTLLDFLRAALGILELP